MLTSLRKSSSVSSFSLACSWSTQCTEFLLFFTQMPFQCPFVLEDSLICLADRGEGEQHWFVLGDFRFMNFTTFCFLIFIFLEDIFLPTTHTHDLYPLPTTHDIYPHPHSRPTPTTHDLYPLTTTHDIQLHSFQAS